MRDATAVTIAAGRVRRGDIPGALAVITRQAADLIDCPSCERPVGSWPMRDCDDPDLHTTAVFRCPCGDELTVEQAVEQEWKHRRCDLIGSTP